MRQILGLLPAAFTRHTPGVVAVHVARRLVTGLLIALLVATAMLSLTGCSSDAMRHTLESMQKEAPELTGATSWVNTKKPVSLNDLRGKIVLLDFSTYSCVNCIHVMPFIKSIERKYGDAVQVITIHSGKYANEKTDSYIRFGIDKYNIDHPVANDADAKLWVAYGAKAWPTMVLINPAGKIVGESSGDSKVGILDKAIRMLVADCENAKTLKRGQPVETVSIRDDQVLKFPSKVLAEKDRMIISDTGHNRLLITSANGKVEKVIGSGRAEDQDGDFKQASFNEPGGFCKVGDLLYVADTGNGAVKVVDLAKGTVGTVARGTKDGNMVLSRSEGVVPFDRPTDVAVDGNRLFVSLNGVHQIWELGLADKKARAIAGSGAEGLADGPGDRAELAQPEGLSIGDGVLYFVDSESSAVRRMSLKDGRVETIVGKGLFEFGDQDGDKKTALLQHPLGLCFSNGKIYVSDSFNHKIKTVDPKTGQCATLCGCGNAGYQDGEFPQMCSPAGLSVNGAQLYVADANNHRIRVFKLADGTMSTIPVSTIPVKN